MHDYAPACVSASVRCTVPGCKFTSFSQAVVDEHLRLHDVEAGAAAPSFTCPECGTSWASLSAMNRHRRAHSVARKYCCRFCDFRSNYSSNVRAHERKFHACELARLSSDGAPHSRLESVHDTRHAVEGAHDVHHAVEGAHDVHHAVEGVHNVHHAVEGAHDVHHAVEGVHNGHHAVEGVHNVHHAVEGVHNVHHGVEGVHDVHHAVESVHDVHHAVEGVHNVHHAVEGVHNVHHAVEGVHNVHHAVEGVHDVHEGAKRTSGGAAFSCPHCPMTFARKSGVSWHVKKVCPAVKRQRVNAPIPSTPTAEVV